MKAGLAAPDTDPKLRTSYQREVETLHKSNNRKSQRKVNDSSIRNYLVYAEKEYNKHARESGKPEAFVKGVHFEKDGRGSRFLSEQGRSDYKRLEGQEVKSDSEFNKAIESTLALKKQNSTPAPAALAPPAASPPIPKPAVATSAPITRPTLSSPKPSNVQAISSTPRAVSIEPQSRKMLFDILNSDPGDRDGAAYRYKNSQVIPDDVRLNINGWLDVFDKNPNARQLFLDTKNYRSDQSWVWPRDKLGNPPAWADINGRVLESFNPWKSGNQKTCNGIFTLPLPSPAK